MPLIRKLLVRDSSGGGQEDCRASTDFDSKAFVSGLGEGFRAVLGGGWKPGDRWCDGGHSHCRTGVRTAGRREGTSAGCGGDGQGLKGPRSPVALPGAGLDLLQAR